MVLKFALTSLAAFASFFLLGFLLSTQTPRLEKFARVKIEEASQKHLPVRILPGKIEVVFFPFGIRIQDVRISPKSEIASLFEPFAVRVVRANINIYYLIQGRFWLSNVEVEGVDLAVTLPKPSRNSAPPLEGLFNALSLAPINRFSIRKASLKIASQEPRFSVDLDQIALSIDKTRSGATFDVSAETVHVADSQGLKPAQMLFETQGEISRKAISVTGLKAQRGDSHFVASGELRGDVESLKLGDFDIEARSTLQLGPLREWLINFSPELAAKIPDLAGTAFAEAKSSKRAGDAQPSVALILRTEGLTIDRRFFLDKIDLIGTYRAGALEISKATMRNPGSRFDLLDAKIAQGDQTTISGKLSTPGVDLHQFLPTVGAKNVPVEMKLIGSFPECKGTLRPNFRVSCTGRVRAENVVVSQESNAKANRDAKHPSGEKKTARRIVAFKEMDADGSFEVTSSQFAYKAELKMPHSRGRSSGAVGYSTGFDFAYEADDLAFADVQSIGELKLEGVVKVNGSTVGNSQVGTIAMKIEARDLWFENWWLGDARATASYKSGELTFSDFVGNYARSRYSGKVGVDFRHSLIAVEATAPFIEARDLTKAISRKYELPVEFTGTGLAQIKLSGPLQFNALSYDLVSTLFKGAIAREPFDQAHFDVRARKGEVEAQKVEISRGQAVIRLEGRGHPNGDIDAIIRGRGLRLENLNAMSAIGAQVAGLLEFDMGLKGYVLAPFAELNGSLKKSAIGEQAVADSSFRLKFGKRAIEGGGTLLGDALKADFTLPLTSDAPFAINLTTHDWNFAPIFSALAGPGSRKEYEARLTSTVRLSAPTGGFWNASGSIDAEKFLIRRGSISVAAPKPILASMRDGRVLIERFLLEGEGSSLRAVNSPNPKAKLDAQFNGKIELSIVALLTPFLEDLRGALSFAFNVKAGPDGGSALGSAYVDHGYLKLFDLPHAFEDVKADALFNERKVLLNSLRGDFAGGKITAEGALEFKGYKNLPLNVNAQIEKVSLNVPNKVATRGSGRLAFSGNWFPYLMKGNYDIRDGLVTMEFESSGGPEGVRRSSFLPNAILQQSASPIAMDLDVSFPRGIEVRNKLVQGHASGDLKIRGAPSNPSMLGVITAEKDVKVTFRDSVIFEVLNGTATFDDPSAPNPRLYLNAQYRLNTAVQDYDVNLVVQGRAKDPKITLTSQPPRPEKDIISLLALGAETSAGDANANTSTVKTGVSSATQATGSGAIVGTQILSKPINEEIKKNTGFDIQLTSGIDDYNATVPKAVASRQFTPKFSISASRTFGQSPKTDAKVRYKLSNKVSVLGSYEGLDRAETGDPTLAPSVDPTTLNKVGLDLEYKFEFK